MKAINWIQVKIKQAFNLETNFSKEVGLKPQAGFGSHPLCGDYS
jgi:hypothetical protein